MQAKSTPLTRLVNRSQTQSRCMDKFVNRKLPPGFRFQPTDEEIVFQYLVPKIFSFPLPATVVPEIDSIFGYDPWDLPGDGEQEKYFFSNKESSYRRNAKRTSRATRGGYWRAIGLDRQISCSKRRMPIVGIKRTLVFCKAKKSWAATTDDWVMHLYSISVPRNNSQLKKQQGCLIQIGKWDLCHVFVKKTSAKSEVHGSLITTAEESDGDSASCCDSDSDSSVLSEEVSSCS